MKPKKKSPKKILRFVRRWTPDILREVVDRYALPFAYETVTGAVSYFRYNPKVLNRDGLYEAGLGMLRLANRTIVTVNTVGKEDSQTYVLHYGHPYQKRYFEELFRIVQKSRHGIGDKLPVIRYTNLNDRQKIEEAISLLLYGSDVKIYHSTIPIEFLIRDDEEMLLGFPENNELSHGVSLWGRDVCATLNKWIQDQSGVAQKQPPPLAANDNEKTLIVIGANSAPQSEKAFTDPQEIAEHTRQKRAANPDPVAVPDHSLIHALDLLAKIETKNPIDATKQAFDRFQDWYPHLYEGEDYRRCYKALAKYVKGLTRRQHPTFLDVGCAQGLGAEILNDNGLRYWGVDVADVLIQKAREEGRHETFIVDDMVKVLLERNRSKHLFGEHGSTCLPDELDVIACQGNTFDFFLGDLQKWFALTLFKSRLTPKGILFVTQRPFVKDEKKVERKVIIPGGEATITYDLDWSGDFVKLDVHFGQQHLGSVIQHPTNTEWLVETSKTAGFDLLDTAEDLGKWFGPRGAKPYKTLMFRLKE